MKWFKHIVMFAPLVSLTVAVVCNSFNILFQDACYDAYYYSARSYLAEFVGFSLVTVLVYSFMAYKHRFCMYSKVAIAGLLFQNMTNLLDIRFDLSYYTNYNIAVLLVLSIFTLFSLIYLRYGR